jgi:hypothetical protein
MRENSGPRVNYFVSIGNVVIKLKMNISIFSKEANAMECISTGSIVSVQLVTAVVGAILKGTESNLIPFKRWQI